MSTYRLISSGEEVERIQAHLNELRLYSGMFKIVGRAGACQDIGSWATSLSLWRATIKPSKPERHLNSVSKKHEDTGWN